MRAVLASPWLAARRFRGRRADYYEYLAALMRQGEGRKTLRDIFDDDVARYGRRSLRGALSARWSERYRESGGDLAETFRGTLPDDDVMLLRAAQLAGAGALTEALADAADTARLLDRAWAAFAHTMLAAGVAALAMFAVLIATPLYTVPALRQTFRVVPPEYWGGRTEALFAAAAGLEAWLPLAVALALAALGAVAWSLPNLAGRSRHALDGWLVWRLYRDFQGVRFLALLSTMARPRGNVAMPLRDALLAQLPGASRWKSWHLHRMVVLLDDGVAGAATFRTGILDPETAWFLADMVAIHGVDGGLARTRQRIEARVLAEVVRRAMALRWVVLLVAVAVLLGMVFWHFGVIDELRRSMQAYYSAR